MERLSEQETSATQHRAGALLRRLVHELNSPLGAIVMEIYSLEALADGMSSEASDNASESLVSNLDEMKAILENLASVRRSMSAILESVQGVGIKLTQEVEAVD